MDIPQTQFTLAWQGFHHVALISSDLDATVRFYDDVLAMQSGDIIPAKGPRGRHVMIKPGNCDAWGLHFFEHTDAQLLAQRETLNQLLAQPQSQFAFLSGTLQHIAFALADETAALELRARLEAYNVMMTPINQVAGIRNFIFLDNNGIPLEAAWPQDHRLAESTSA